MNMCDLTDNFGWIHQLECPSTICTASVKKILSKGVLEFLWAEIDNSIFTTSEVDNIRKNILLHKLRNRSNDSVIQCTRNISELVEHKNKLKSIASSLQEEYEKEDFSVCHKAQNLKRIKSKCTQTVLKKNLIKMKYSETCTEINNCKDVKLIFQNLMPSTCKDLNQDKIRESLNTIVTLCNGTDKKQVRNKITNLLGHIEIPTLWTHLYQTLQQDLDDLIKLKNTEVSEDVNTFRKNIDIGIARMCGQHICMVSNKFSYDTRAKKYQDVIMQYIKRIEETYKDNMDPSEWLSLTLETCKLETQKVCLQNEIEKMKDDINDNGSSSNLSQLVSQMQAADTEVETYVRYIQQSFILLKSAESTINNIKDKLSEDFMKITLMQAETYDFKWLNYDLSTELNIFNYKLDLNALNKIVLKRETRAPRYITSCLKEASTLPVSVKIYKSIYSIPIIQSPVYCLFNCYNHLMMHHLYKTIETSILSPKRIKDTYLPELIQQNNNFNIMEIIQPSRQNCDKAVEEIKEFHALLHDWSEQNVQEVMSIVNQTVDNMSFKDWLSRYNK